MLYDPQRHEALRVLPWDEAQARDTIAAIVADTESHFTQDTFWPVHPLDRESESDPVAFETPLYHGACGVIWALHYLQSSGAVRLTHSYLGGLDRLIAHNRAWLGEAAQRECASFMMGDTPLQMLALGAPPSEHIEQELHRLITGNADHPARELMWGSPGTLLA